MLLQKQINGEWNAVAYMSRQTTEAETKYHSYELETLAVLEALKRFRNYMVGTSLIKRTVMQCD